jgi:hypothetical protein
MINLAGNLAADEMIQEELIIANIDLVRGEKSSGEVPYTITGRLGDWTFNRGWCYWTARAPKGKGFVIDIATALHEMNYPITGTHQPKKYGEVIRVAGNCTCPHPKQWAFPVEKDLNEWSKISRRNWQEISYRNLAKLCNDGEITGQRFVNLYDIDTQIGLNQFARIISASLD